MKTVFCAPFAESRLHKRQSSVKNITLKKLAEIAAKTNNKKVIFELPDAIERAGYSTATKAILNNNKIRKLGWEAKIPIKEGIIKTISIIKDTYS